MTDEPAVFRSAEELSGLPDDTKLLRGEKVQDEDLAEIGRLPVLTGLYLDGCFELGDAALESIAALTGLEEFYISGNGITDDGLRHVGSLVELEVLGLDAPVTGEGFAHLVGLTKLRTIHLPFCPKVEPESFALLSALPALAELCIYGCKRMDDSWLEPIAKVGRLTTLVARDCPGVTSEGLAKLGGSHPSLEVRTE